MPQIPIAEFVLRLFCESKIPLESRYFKVPQQDLFRELFLQL